MTLYTRVAEATPVLRVRTHADPAALAGRDAGAPNVFNAAGGRAAGERRR